MKNKKSYFMKNIISIFVVLILVSTTMIGTAIEEKSSDLDTLGNDKGPSYKTVIPVEKVTMINYDENSLLDDYSYLAGVPTAAFQYEDKIISHPILFYQDYYDVTENKEKTFNARQGLDFFMEDWMSYCNGELDQITLVNVPEDKLDYSWRVKDGQTKIIEGKNPYDIASQFALNDWSYSNKAVISVIEEDFKTPDYSYSNILTESLDSSKILTERHTVSQVNQITPQFEGFTVPEGYKYLKARLWYPCYYFSFMMFNITIPPGDPNLELFCKHKGEWMEVAATFGWNQMFGMDLEKAESYVYETGDWQLAVTDVPTHAGEEDNIDVITKIRKLGPFTFGRYGSFMDALKNIRNTEYNIDISMFPGKNIDLPDNPPYGCRNASFKLTWDDPSVKLGFSLIGPAGEEVLSASDEDVDYQELKLDQLGECLDGEQYSICVFSMGDINRDIDFEIEYSWKQGFSKEKGDSLTSATEGAVLASALNAPLLYTKTSELSDVTEETLYKLGVKEVYIMDFGSNVADEVIDSIKEVASITKQYKNLETFYMEMKELTGQNDIIITTIDPWTYYYSEEGGFPVGEKEGAHFIGPAAYIAAHHGSPVIIVDNHPELSSSVVWHTEFWKRYPDGHTLPSVAEMYLTGKRTYAFFDKIGYDEDLEEEMETMITVADQYDIGTPWDRVFFGKAKAGRFFGTPVDISYWISRSVFYPQLVFINPATDSEGVELQDGSESERRFPWWSKLGLRVNEKEKETYVNPVLQIYLCYNHHFNERASKYYGWKYKCIDGMVPGESITFDSIDDGVVPGKKGCYFADFTTSEVIPFYLDRGGYQNVFSTNFEAVTENLNEGVVLWVISTHGLSNNGTGSLEFWNPASSFIHEENPWRGYEWYLGSTEEPDTLTMEMYGVIPMLFGNPTEKGLTGHGVFRTALDYGFAKKPILDLISKLPLVKTIFPWMDPQDYYDGVINSVLMNRVATTTYSGYEIDEKLDNLHSVGIINSACLVANKYLHLTFIRHGSVFQIIDPWATSWYAVWQQFVPRNIALGQTIGDAFVSSISHVGILYITEPPQWGADNKQNVCFFGDPDLRPYVPGTDYSEKNYWTKDETKSLKYDEDFIFGGHNPYGATSYPHEKQPKSFIESFFMEILVIILLIIAALVVIGIKRKKKN